MFNGHDGLIRVPAEDIDSQIIDDYPNIHSLFTYTPSWFSSVADNIMPTLNLSHEKLKYCNIWVAFRFMRNALLDHNWDGTLFEGKDLNAFGT